MLDFKDKNKAAKIIRLLCKEHENTSLRGSVPGIIALRELTSLCEQKIEFSEIISALSIMKEGDKRDLDSFIFALQKYRKSRRRRRWTLLVPLNANIHRKNLKLLGLHLKIQSKKKLSKEYKNQEFVKYNLLSADFGHTEFLNPEPYYILISVLGFNLFDAWRTWDEVCVTLMGTLNFVLSHGDWNILISPGRSRAKVLYPDKFYAIKSLKHYYFPLVDQDKSSRFPADLNRIQKKNLDDILKILEFSPRKGTTEDLISNSIRLYHHAMYTVNNFQCFLNFWQLAENLALSENFGGETDKVLSRIVWHFEKYKNSLIEGIPTSIYTSLKKTRNEVVHRGYQNIDSSDLGVLKIICEDALIWLIRHRTKLRNENELEEYYQLRTANKKELKKRNSRVSKIILAERSN